MKPGWSRLVATVLLLLSAGVAARGAETALSPGEKLFETEIRPLFVQRCFKCHSEKSQKGQLRVDSLASLLSGGESGQAVVPGKPEESLLIDAIEHDGLEMPPDGKLKPEQVAAVRRWVELGAPWPGHSAAAAPAKKGPRGITEEDRAWWAYQAIRSPVVPTPVKTDWARNDIDRFVLARLEQEGLQPNPEASRRVLVRRLSFDLRGLPPTPEEVAAAEADAQPDWYERLVERFLASPQYGERWARHWLDLVRYAESDGYRIDTYRPTAWRYRDYVIEAFQRDKPYDQFLREQLAGDELGTDDPQALIATGYFTLGIYEYNQRDVETQWDFMLNEITDVTADVFLGTGLACARCHDHKFDPLLQKDYFRLRAYFEALSPRTDVPLASAAEQAKFAERWQAWEEKTRAIREELAALEQAVVKSVVAGALKKFPVEVQPIFAKQPEERTAREQQLFQLAYRQAQLEIDKLDFSKKLKGEKLERWQQLQAELKEFAAEKPAALPVGLTATDIDAVAPATLIPGKKQAEPIEPGPLSVLDPRPAVIPLPDAHATTTGRRLALANWLTSRENPLPARVMANRIWQYHFGKGLVATSSDFGHLGEPPSHPELLDYLATQFRDGGWSVKQLHRLILHSATYRQTAQIERDDPALETDPANRLLWRQQVRRLDAEQVRDAMLHVSGELDLAGGGPAVDVKTPRRTIFTKVLRNTRDPLLAAYDGPEGIASLPERSATTTPLQALVMMNSPWSLDRAKALATRVQKSSPALPDAVRRAWLLACGYEPNAQQVSSAVAFVNAQREQLGQGKELAALTDYCHVLLNSSPFLYVD